MPLGEFVRLDHRGVPAAVQCSQARLPSIASVIFRSVMSG
jgi:hypothetical protein